MAEGVRAKQSLRLAESNLSDTRTRVGWYCTRVGLPGRQLLFLVVPTLRFLRSAQLGPACQVGFVARVHLWSSSKDSNYKPCMCYAHSKKAKIIFLGKDQRGVVKERN